MSQRLTGTFLTCLLAMSGIQTAVALEKVDDQQLAETTGEGVALLPTAFSFVMQDEDASYINLIPRGQLSAQVTNNDSNARRADIFLRNLSITRSDDTFTRASGSRIRSWGSGDNPFVLVVKTLTAPNYTGTSALPYFEFQMPNYCPTGVSDAANCPSGADTDTALDAYSIRLGLTADLILKNDGEKQGYGTLVGKSLKGLEGIGLQAIWNGLSVNGSRFAIFQTPSGSSTATDNATLGIRGILRLNTNTSVPNSGLSIATQLHQDYDGNSNRLFNRTEGLKIGDLSINLPLGAPNYQALTFGPADASGNFYVELTRIPNNPDAYNLAYINYDNATQVSNRTCTATRCGTATAVATHGTVEMSNMTLNSVDLGSSQVNGIFIQHMKLSTTGL